MSGDPGAVGGGGGPSPRPFLTISEMRAQPSVRPRINETVTRIKTGRGVVPCCISLRIRTEDGIVRGNLLAERVGFEPTEPVKAQQFSRLPDSTTLAPLRANL